MKDHDTTIKYDKKLGVHRTYRGYKYQPRSMEYSYINPLGEFGFIVGVNLKGFMAFVDKELK